MSVYYQDEQVTLYHGDCLEIGEWLAADVLVTDPPYGRAWKARAGWKNASGGGGHRSTGQALSIANDADAGVRDDALEAWGDRPAVVFGDPLIAQPARAVQALVYAKPEDSGIRGARAGFRRDVEMVYLVGKGWPVHVGGRSSVLGTSALVAGPRGLSVRYEHPHAKPVDLLERVINACPSGVIADPFAGSGSTLVASKNVGRSAVGVEMEERYCEVIAKRLAQGVLDFGGVA